MYNLLIIFSFQLSFLLFTYILFKSLFLSIIIPLTFSLFIFEINRKDIESFYKFFITILSIILVIFFNLPITFQIFLKISLFSFIYILILIIIKNENSNYISTVFLIINLIFYEKIFTNNLFIYLISFILIIFSLYYKLQKNKSFYFWENNFVLLNLNKERIVKNLLSILLISIIIVSTISLINIKFFERISLPQTFFNSQNFENKKEIFKETKDTLSFTIKRFSFRISNISQKILNFIVNCFYLILFFGILIALILLVFRFYNLIKFVYGKKKSIRFLILSFFISILIILSPYFLYKPFELFIKSVTKNLKIENIGRVPIIELIDRIRRVFSGNQIINEKQIPISIDIGLIILLSFFVTMTTLFLYYLIFYLYKSTYNERQIELNKILEEFQDEKGEFFKIKGTPKEKIIALYNFLIKKLNLVISRFSYETPNEYRVKFKKEKPEFSNEIDIITDNFIISKYSNYNVSEDLFNNTFLAYRKLSNKIFKEVYFGREI